jgi:alkaline phosphatase
MKHILFYSFVTLFSQQGLTQNVQPAPIGHCHNDYRLTRPFTTAFNAGMQSIEADVFLKKGVLCVAHTRFQLKQTRTLDKLYLQPIAELLNQKKACNIQLMIDIKNRRKATLNKIIEELKCYDTVFNECSTIKVVISGKRPAQKDWNTFPNYIYFDGRPSEKYSETQQCRLGMISDNFRHYKHRWKKDTTNRENALKTVVAECHAKGEKIRFWNVPNTIEAWKKLVALGVDIINTDKPEKLKLFFQKGKVDSSQ